MKNETHTYTTTRLPTQQPLTHENSPLAQSTVWTRNQDNLWFSLLLNNDSCAYVKQILYVWYKTTYYISCLSRYLLWYRIRLVIPSLAIKALFTYSNIINLAFHVRYKSTHTVCCTLCKLYIVRRIAYSK